MNKMTRGENSKLRCNLECKICKTPFEFIDEKNGEAVVTSINEINTQYGIKDESIDFEIKATCSVCGYKSKYNGILKL